MKRLIYDFNIHSFYYYDNLDTKKPIFSLALDTLELIFEKQTGKLIGVQGFFPLLRAIRSSIDIPISKKEYYCLNQECLSTCRENELYELIDKVPKSKKYFEKMFTKYDKENGIIQIGEEMKQNEITIQVDNSIFCGLDKNSQLKCIYILPTEFV